MTTFNKREKSFEKKFQHDQELQFKVEARRNKLLGLWVAEEVGMSAEQAQAYARDVVSSDFEEPGDADVVRKVLADLASHGVEFTEHRLRHKMEELMTEAKAQVMQELPPE